MHQSFGPRIHKIIIDRIFCRKNGIQFSQKCIHSFSAFFIYCTANWPNKAAKRPIMLKYTKVSILILKQYKIFAKILPEYEIEADHDIKSVVIFMIHSILFDCQRIHESTKWHDQIQFSSAHQLFTICRFECQCFGQIEIHVFSILQKNSSFRYCLPNLSYIGSWLVLWLMNPKIGFFTSLATFSLFCLPNQDSIYGFHPKSR